jgi:hypothetical protein
MLWVPALNVVVEYAPTPALFNVAMPRVVALSRKVTLPVGAPMLPLGPVTTAVKVILPPAVIVADEAVSAVVVDAGGLVLGAEP